MNAEDEDEFDSSGQSDREFFLDEDEKELKDFGSKRNSNQDSFLGDGGKMSPKKPKVSMNDLQRKANEVFNLREKNKQPTNLLAKKLNYAEPSHSVRNTGLNVVMEERNSDEDIDDDRRQNLILAQKDTFKNWTEMSASTHLKNPKKFNSHRVKAVADKSSENKDTEQKPINEETFSLQLAPKRNKLSKHMRLPYSLKSSRKQRELSKAQLKEKMMNILNDNMSLMALNAY
mmetsp:Transcript_19541/g.18654  ORF Transcript_19541/g.18654 Transcript_19541/m.18654 type:complete len:231 (+) Transcript_19541:946-1638(+)